MTIADDMARDLAEAQRLAAQAGSADPEGVLAALDRFANLISGFDAIRVDASDGAKDLIRRALQLGVDQRDLYARPFSGTVVRKIASELGVGASKRGPRRRIKPNITKGGTPA